ncbi:hypothetical protein [Cryptosporangium phraense]|uniref:Uncharacterized protein n=1 Tax=Cryptosporangium phraense TaxID=2593070 RepID=A0A545AIF9_9ACTN|nr:hypothetical protein [Cryptosporangium phraense]TQS40475.1 hypothetical protein FL583_34615 [Cryptosporangium phraense]
MDGALIQRAVFGLLGIALAVGGVFWAGAPLDRLADYRRVMESCASGGAECPPAETGRVTDRWREIPVHAGGGGVPSWGLRVERADGSEWTGPVDSAIEAAARVGDPVRLRTWQGRVVQVTVRGKTDSMTPPGAWGAVVPLLAGWAGLGLLVWRTLRQAVCWAVLGFGPATLVVDRAEYGDLLPPNYTGVFWICYAATALFCVAGLVSVSRRDAEVFPAGQVVG